MNYRVIDYESWPRREKYEFFCAADQPFYNLGYRLNVTNAYSFAKKNGVSFYMVLTYLVTKAINSVEAFRCARLDGQIVLFDELMPSFTDLKPGSDSFHIVTMPAGDDILAFCREAKRRSSGAGLLHRPEHGGAEPHLHLLCAVARYHRHVARAQI